jgi:hypothetical protein
MVIWKHLYFYFENENKEHFKLYKPTKAKRKREKIKAKTIRNCKVDKQQENYIWGSQILN